MENILQMLGPLVIVLLIAILSNARRRKAQQQQLKEERMNVRCRRAIPHRLLSWKIFRSRRNRNRWFCGRTKKRLCRLPKEPARPEPRKARSSCETPQSQVPPVPVDSPTRMRSVPATSLLDLSPQTFRQGIILAEIPVLPKHVAVGNLLRSENHQSSVKRYFGNNPPRLGVLQGTMDCYRRPLY